MKKYRRICAYMLGLYMLLIALFQVFYYFGSSQSRVDHPYDVDVNRIVSYTEANKGIVPDITEYTYVTAVEILPYNANADERNKFFNNDNRLYEIKNICLGNEFTCIKCILNEDLVKGSGDILIAADILFAIVFIMLVIGMFYFGHRLLRPFNEIQEMPFELAKGHIATPVKEIKNRYFGRFTWGLDMLREQLGKR